MPVSQDFSLLMQQLSDSMLFDVLFLLRHLVLQAPVNSIERAEGCGEGYVMIVTRTINEGIMSAMCSVVRSNE